MSPRELPISFSFSAIQARRLKGALLEVKSNPYSEYRDFKGEVARIVNSGVLPVPFMERVQAASASDGWDSPFVFIESVPLDDDLPILDNSDPTLSKRATKRTFVIEGYLEVYSQVSGCAAIGYRNVNDGDIFHDVYPKEDLFFSQSQKALGPFYFHKDLASDSVPADYVNIVSVRSTSANQIYNTFASNKDVLLALGSKTKEVLLSPQFCTQLDDRSDSAAGGPGLENARRHAILQEDGRGLFFFETRTKGLTEHAQRAVQDLTHALHGRQKRVLMLPGDFVSISNHMSLHGKEVHKIQDEAAMRHRWSMKTVNVRNLAQYARYFESPDSPIVNA